MHYFIKAVILVVIILSARFFTGLGLKNVGTSTSVDVMLHFGGFLNLWTFIQNERGWMLWLLYFGHIF